MSRKKGWADEPDMSESKFPQDWAESPEASAVELPTHAEPTPDPEPVQPKRIARLVGCEGQVHFRGITISSHGAVIPSDWTDSDIEALSNLVEVK